MKKRVDQPLEMILRAWSLYNEATKRAEGLRQGIQYMEERIAEEAKLGSFAAKQPRPQLDMHPWERERREQGERWMREWRAKELREDREELRRVIQTLAVLVPMLRCGARTRKGSPCQCKPMPGKRRCRLHGGLSTGARSEAGRARLSEIGRRGGIARWEKARAKPS
jgi:hypothetical protein